MTAPVYIDIATRELPERPVARRRVLFELARLEARHSLRAPWLWLGIVLSIASAHSTLDADYAGGGYQGVVASFTGVAAGIFVLGVLAGNRDRSASDDVPLAPESVLDGGDRALARLLGLVPAIIVASVFAATVFAVSRIEGGFWLGNEPGRTDAATHGPFEALQPLVLVVLAAAAGVAIGRASAHRTLACIGGVLVAAVSGFVYWAWQGDGMVFVSLVQTQPLHVPIDWPADQVDLGSVQPDWVLSEPTAYQSGWHHVVIDQRIAAAHDAYLLALAAVASGFAIRGRRGRVIGVAGGLVAIAAVVAQFAITPGV